jgi:hypothetical protein
MTSSWFSGEYCWCSVDILTYCAARVGAGAVTDVAEGSMLATNPGSNFLEGLPHKTALLCSAYLRHFSRQGHKKPANSEPSGRGGNINSPKSRRDPLETARERGFLVLLSAGSSTLEQIAGCSQQRAQGKHRRTYERLSTRPCQCTAFSASTYLAMLSLSMKEFVNC